METRRRSTTGLLLLATPVVLVFGAAACGGDDDAGPPRSPEAAEGRQIAVRSGCAACHGADGQGGTGPAWDDVLGTDVMLDDGSTVTADEAYLARSIADPDAEVVDGFSIKMPQNQLTDEEIAKVVAYIVALNEPVTGGTGG
ncbi:MAG: c-type cytochrome [Ilumatobacteraceae bacterium]